LEKKQAREKEKVTVTFSENGTSFTRMGSFRQTTLTERLADPQSAIVAGLQSSMNNFNKFKRIFGADYSNDTFY